MSNFLLGGFRMLSIVGKISILRTRSGITPRDGTPYPAKSKGTLTNSSN